MSIDTSTYVPLLQGTFQSVTAEFIVPTPKEPHGGHHHYASAAAWVGIDGETCDTGIIQTGVDFTISNGHVTYDGQSQSHPEITLSRAHGRPPFLQLGTNFGPPLPKTMSILRSMPETPSS